MLPMLNCTFRWSSIFIRGCLENSWDFWAIIHRVIQWYHLWQICFVNDISRVTFWAQSRWLLLHVHPKAINLDNWSISLEWWLLWLLWMIVVTRNEKILLCVQLWCWLIFRWVIKWYITLLFEHVDLRPVADFHWLLQLNLTYFMAFSPLILKLIIILDLLLKKLKTVLLLWFTWLHVSFLFCLLLYQCESLLFLFPFL